MTKNPTKNARVGLTLSEALSDPLVRAVMRADKIDPPYYEAFLRQTAGRLAQRRSEWLTTVPTSAPSAATVEAVCC